MKVVIRVAIAITLLWVVMTAFGLRININQTEVNDGERYPSGASKEYGEIHSGSKVLVCSYFTGKSIVHSVFWYSPNNMMGRDSCPIWMNDK